MRTNLLSIFISLVLLVSCKNEIKKNEDIEDKIGMNIVKEYPEVISKLFDAHGKIAHWNEMNTLDYTIKKAGIGERQRFDLYREKCF